MTDQHHSSCRHNFILAEFARPEFLGRFLIPGTHPDENVWLTTEQTTSIVHVMSHTSSRTWVAPLTAEKEKWLQAEAQLKRTRLIPRSPFVPKSFDEWLAFRVECMVAAEEEEKRRLRFREVEASIPTRVNPPFGAKTFSDNRGAVLLLPTVWSPWVQSTEARPLAPWPSQEEMKEEGDERHTSGYGRFPALPRVPGNETVNWKQKNLVDTYPLDKVWDKPWATMIEPALDKKRAEELIGQDLLAALNE